MFHIKINEATIGNVEDLDLVTTIYNLTEYCSNYSETIGSLNLSSIRPNY